MTSNYRLHHGDISLNNFCSPNKQLEYLGRSGKIFIFQIFLKKNKIISITKKIPQDVSLYVRFLHQEQKYPICVIRRRYPEKKIVQIAVFQIIIVTGIWITKKYFSSVSHCITFSLSWFLPDKIEEYIWIWSLKNNKLEQAEI